MTKAKIKYVARLNGTIVGTRSSARVLTHAVVLNGHDKTDHVETWCSTLANAQAVQRRYERCAFRADVVPAERIEPKPARSSSVDAIAAPAQTMIMCVGRRAYAVSSLQQASEMFCEARDRSGRGASETPTPVIVDSTGAVIGHVAYNGRVFSGTSWTRDQTLLYENREPGLEPIRAGQLNVAAGR